MPRRYRLPIIAVVGIALAATANAQPIGRDGGKQDGTEQGQSEPSRQPDPAPRITTQDILDRIARALEAANNKPEPADETERAKRDLDAQERMAKWAFWMFVAAVASVGLTAAGVFLIWRTLVHTRDAAIAARDMVVEAKATTKAASDGAVAAEASVEEARKQTKFAQAAAEVSREALIAADRAWIKVEIELLAPVEFTSTQIKTKAKFTFTNIGDSPALQVTVEFAEWCVSITEASYKAQETYRRWNKSIAATLSNFGRVLFPKDHFSHEIPVIVQLFVFQEYIKEIKENPITKTTDAVDFALEPAILAGVRYVLPGDNKVRVTYIPFSIRQKDNTPFEYDGREYVVQAEDIELTQGFMSGVIS